MKSLLLVKKLLVYLIVQVILRISGIVISFYGENLFITHLIGLTDLIFVYLIYEDQREYITRGVVAILAIIYIYDSIFITTVNNINNIGLALVQILVLGLGVNYLFRLFKRKFLLPLKKEPFFFINAGFMLFASSSFFTYLMSSKIITKSTNELFYNAWIFEVGFGILRLLLITYGLILILREK